MRGPALRLRRPSAAAVQRLLADSREAVPTYPEVGATRAVDLPAGYRHDRCEIHVGRGPDVFERAVRALRGWQAQRGAGVEVVPDDAWVEEQETVVLLLHVGGLWATAPCRVVYVVEEADHVGFAYGTLPGHPECGEAAFAVSRGATGAVVFRVWSFSRTIDPLARLGAPVTRRIQKRVTRRYLDALVEAANAPEGSHVP
jgi:uncharacterized protein (UPF0548 family)